MISSTSLPSRAAYTRTNQVTSAVVMTSEKVAAAAPPSAPAAAEPVKALDTKNASGKPDWSYYLSYNNVDHSQEDFVRNQTEGGRLLSQSQGLPEGHYDFSRMNRTEMTVALNDIVINRRAPQDVIDGLSQLANTTYDEPLNHLEIAAGSIEYEASQKNTVVVGFLKAALAYMKADQSLLETLKPKELTTQEALSSRNLPARSTNAPA